MNAMTKHLYQTLDGLHADLGVDNSRASVRKHKYGTDWQPSLIHVHTSFFSVADARRIREMFQTAHEIATAWDRDPEAALADLQETEGA